MNPIKTDIIIVGAGLAGLVAAAEATAAGKHVALLDQEHASSLGGQAFWSLGGLFLVNTPEQRLMGIRDTKELAWQDWLGTAAFDRSEDLWARRWAEAYVDFSAGENRSWITSKGLRFMKIVGWAERGGYLASGHGNSVPRFHILWGTGPAIIEPFIAEVKRAEKKGLLKFYFRHRVTELIVDKGAVTGVKGNILETSNGERGVSTTRNVVGDFKMSSQAVIITAGGIGGNHDLVRQYWPARLGSAPKYMLSGVPEYVDGSMLSVATSVGANFINKDRMWHYPEGLHNHTPIWPNHGIRILSGPTSLWVNAVGVRLPSPLFPGFDTYKALSHINRHGYDHSWFILNKHIIEKEFTLSGSEQNPDFTNKSLWGLLKRMFPGSKRPVDRFQEAHIDVVESHSIYNLAEKMNQLVGDDLIEPLVLEKEILDRDRQVETGLGKDQQINAIREARRYLGDKLLRVATLDKLTNPKHGPLIAIRLSILTRKTLGGLQTDLSSRVLKADGQPIPGLYAAGEIAGFGGGGMHGYRALEGTFLGGCLFSGRVAGRSAAQDI